MNNENKFIEIEELDKISDVLFKKYMDKIGESNVEIINTTVPVIEKLMIAIILDAKAISKKKEKEFKGLSIYTIQKVFFQMNVSSDTVRDHVRRLVEMGKLERIPDGKIMRFKVRE